MTCATAKHSSRPDAACLTPTNHCVADDTDLIDQACRCCGTDWGQTVLGGTLGEHLGHILSRDKAGNDPIRTGGATALVSPYPRSCPVGFLSAELPGSDSLAVGILEGVNQLIGGHL